MKNIFLVKSYPNFQIAHLYEHIVLRYINEYMHQKGVFKYVDYFAEGTTYSQGAIIAVDCVLYSNKALKQVEFFNDLSVKFDTHNTQVKLALSQLMAEEDNAVIVDNLPELENQISIINKQEWVEIDALEYIDSSKIRKNRKLIYNVESKNKVRKKLHIGFMLKSDFAKNNRHLLPLYCYITRLFSYTICDRLSYEYGAYHANNIEINPKTNHSSTYLWLMPESSSKISTEKVTSLAQSTISFLISNGALDRLIDLLATANYKDMKSIPPNFDSILVSTLIAIGARGWKAIATQDNVEQILHNLQFQIKYNKKSDNFDVSTIA